MNPYCCKCYSIDPDPVESDGGDQVCWFKLEEDENGEESVSTLGLDENGEMAFLFIALSEKHFDYDESFKIVCPDCVVEQYASQKEEEELF